jgi:hypothetical protein
VPRRRNIDLKLVRPEHETVTTLFLFHAASE